MTRLCNKDNSCLRVFGKSHEVSFSTTNYDPVKYNKARIVLTNTAQFADSYGTCIGADIKTLSLYRTFCEQPRENIAVIWNVNKTANGLCQYRIGNNDDKILSNSGKIIDLSLCKGNECSFTCLPESFFQESSFQKNTDIIIVFICILAVLTLIFFFV